MNALRVTFVDFIGLGESVKVIKFEKYYVNVEHMVCYFVLVIHLQIISNM